MVLATVTGLGIVMVLRDGVRFEDDGGLKNGDGFGYAFLTPSFLWLVNSASNGGLNS